MVREMGRDLFEDRVIRELAQWGGGDVAGVGKW